MSVRLNVVLSQSAGGPPARRELESDIVGRLLGAAGIDLSLIGPLQQLGDSSTDRLMLEQLGGDLALLSWEPPTEAAKHLAAAGIAGRRARHRLDPDAPAPPPAAPAASRTAPDSADAAPLPAGRRIYYHHLQSQTAPGLQRVLQQLLSERRVVTFQLAPLPVAARASKDDEPASRSVARPQRPSIAASATHRPQPAASEPGGTPTEEPASDPRPLRQRGRTSANRCEPADPWDALVDELNESDI